MLGQGRSQRAVLGPSGLERRVVPKCPGLPRGDLGVGPCGEGRQLCKILSAPRADLGLERTRALSKLDAK